MKQIIIKVENCKLCPYHDIYGDCMITGSNVRNYITIPDGCPLEECIL